MSNHPFKQKGFNKSKWGAFSKRYLECNPFCRMCKSLGLITRSQATDHIIPLRDAPDRIYDESNLQPLCKYHHDSVKQREENSGRSIGCDEYGNPIEPNPDWER